MPLAQRADRMLALLLQLYGPLPEISFRQLVRMVTESSLSRAMGERAITRMLAADGVTRALVDGVPWLWPAGMRFGDEPTPRVRVFAPFDPVVWDRRRFAILWGWEYRLEAYTPPSKRVFGYYALPIVWRDDAVGWANASVVDGTLRVSVHYARAVPRARVFRRELEEEFERLRAFVGALRLDLKLA